MFWRELDFFDDPFLTSNWVRDSISRLNGGATFPRGSSWAMEGPANFPLVNIWADENGAHLTAEIPGVDPKDLDISVTGNTVTIKGQRKELSIGEGQHYVRKERPYGQFERSIELPFNLESGAVNAEYRDGIVRIQLPRAEAEKPRRVSIN